MRKNPAPAPADDPTARSSAPDALSAGERRFRVLIEKSWDGIALVDGDGRFLYVSPSVERILGYTPQELIGRRSAEFVLGDVDERKRAFDALVREPGKSATAELRYRHRDGRQRLTDRSSGVVR